MSNRWGLDRSVGSWAWAVVGVSFVVCLSKKEARRTSAHRIVSGVRRTHDDKVGVPSPGGRPTEAEVLQCLIGYFTVPRPL